MTSIKPGFGITLPKEYEVKISYLDDNPQIHTTNPTNQISGITKISVNNCLKPKTSAFDILRLSNQTEVVKLTNQQRIIQLTFPAQDYHYVINTLDLTNLVLPFEKTPNVKSTEEKNTSITALSISDQDLQLLKKLIKVENLNWQVTCSAHLANVFHINGAISHFGRKIPLEDLPVVQNQTSKIDLPEKNTKDIQEYYQIPRFGPCSYLIIDFNFNEQENSQYFQKLLDDLSILSKSKDFFFSFNQQNQLIIIALQERAVGFIGMLAKNLQKHYSQKLSFFLGKGNITHFSKEKFIIDGLPNIKQSQNFHQISQTQPGLYSNQDFLDKTKHTRDETNILIEEKGTISNLREIEISPQTDFVSSSGPDRLIGLVEEQQVFNSSLALNNDQKLILIEGGAGTGKSRLIDEYTQYLPHQIKMSFNPAGRNIPGFSLASLADQIWQFTEINQQFSPQNNQGSIKKLQEFHNKSESEKLLEANQYPGILVYYIQQAILTLEEKLGSIVVILDDLHHIDRHSDPYVTKVIEDLVNFSLPHFKLLLARRPEARYSSISQNNLIKQYSPIKISLQDSKGKSKLNFKNPDTTRDYVQYSLPEKLRYESDNQIPRQLGPWSEELGKIATTPFELSSILQELLVNADQNLLIQKDYIDLSPAGREKINKIIGQDLLVYHLEKIRDQLDQKTQTALQIICLIGQKFSPEESLVEVLSQIISISSEQILVILDNLTEQNYLIKRTRKNLDGTFTSYSLWHENIRDMVLKYTFDQGHVSQLSFDVFNSLENSGFLSRQTSDQQKFYLLNQAANTIDLEDFNFWKKYSHHGEKTLTEAKNRHLHSLGFSYSEAIFQTLLPKINHQHPTEKGLKELFHLAICGLVEHGYHLGQFPQVYQTLDFVQTVKNEFEKEQIISLIITTFDAAYAQMNLAKLKECYQLLQEYRLSPEQALQIELKLAYRQGLYSQCQSQLNNLKSTEPLSLELERLEILVKLQLIKEKIASSGIDEDAMMAGQDFSQEQNTIINDLFEQVCQLKTRLNDARDQKGRLRQFSNMDQLYFLDIEGQIAALQGFTEEGIQIFNENWRLAMQMDIPKEAARAAKQKGDLEVIQALNYKMIHAHDTIFYRKYLRSAISTYNEDGLEIANKLVDPTYSFLINVQKLRAICLLIDNFDSKEITDNLEDVIQLIDSGQTCLKKINQEPWINSIPDPNSSQLTDYATTYYVTPYILWFRFLANKCYQIALSDQSLSPQTKKLVFSSDKTAFEQEYLIDGAKIYAETMVQNIDQIGENNRKLNGLYLKEPNQED